jgi:hypothetical protein
MISTILSFLALTAFPNYPADENVRYSRMFTPGESSTYLLTNSLKELNVKLMVKFSTAVKDVLTDGKARVIWMTLEYSAEGGDRGQKPEDVIDTADAHGIPGNLIFSGNSNIYIIFAAAAMAPDQEVTLSHEFPLSWQSSSNSLKLDGTGKVVKVDPLAHTLTTERTLQLTKDGTFLGTYHLTSTSDLKSGALISATGYIDVKVAKWFVEIARLDGRAKATVLKR